jgi:hypothetical protein
MVESELHGILVLCPWYTVTPQGKPLSGSADFFPVEYKLCVTRVAIFSREAR